MKEIEKLYVEKSFSENSRNPGPLQKEFLDPR